MQKDFEIMQSDLFGADPEAPRQIPDKGMVRVAHVSFSRTEDLPWTELFKGFTRLRATTWSASMPALMKVADLFDEIDVALGYEGIVGRDFQALEAATLSTEINLFGGDLQAQGAVLEGPVRQALRKSPEKILKAVREGRIRIRIARGHPSHQKIYCLEGEDRCRVIVGSANMSIAALTGSQAETFLVMDNDRAAMDFYDEEIARVAKSSDLTPPDILLKLGQDDDVELEEEDLPLIRKMREASVVVLQKPADETGSISPETLDSIRKWSKAGREVSETVVPEKRKDGAAVLVARTYLEQRVLQRRNPPADTPVPDSFSLDMSTGSILSGNDTWHVLGSDVSRKEARADAERFMEFIDGFGGFRGRAEDLRRSYWILACWMFLSPFIGARRNQLILRDEDPLDWPICAVLYGNSNAGKSAVSRAIARAMFGMPIEMTGKDMTAPRLRERRHQVGILPVLVDDLSNRRFTEHMPDILKVDRDLREPQSPIIISTNKDVRGISPDLRKRMILIHTAASCPRSYPKGPVNRMKDVGTSFFRYFLNHAHDLQSDGEIDQGLGAVSSQAMEKTLSDLLGGHPDWASEIGSDEIDTLRDTPFIFMLEDMLRSSAQRVSWSEDGSEIHVSLEDAREEAGRWEKQAPPQVLKTRSANTFVFDVAALSEDYGFQPERWRPGSKRRWWPF